MNPTEALLSPQENHVINFFSDATPMDWEDWQWQVRHRFTTIDILKDIIDLTPEEKKGIEGCGDKLTMSIPPYFASLIDPNDPACPIHDLDLGRRFEYHLTHESPLGAGGHTPPWGPRVGQKVGL